MPFTAAAAVFPASGELQITPSAAEFSDAVVLTQRSSVATKRVLPTGRQLLKPLTAVLPNDFPQWPEKYARQYAFFPVLANVRFPVRSNGP
ncbi:hypothetical protein [Pontibacter liquoris]|uniref:hypothetical protein n=1 Tax=Pontibacter liquoris TaxID=2905677 RepID=UPI001FA70949|nr:hypothetical protein [Pontibacter liquoris]